MKPQHFAALAGTLVIMALILLVAGRPGPGTDQAATKPPRLVTVTGEGEIRTKPDQVTLAFDVSTWTQGASAAEAEALNLASVERLVTALKNAGADGGAIDPQRPVVTPLTRQDYAGKTYLTGYQASAQVVVTLTAIQRADAVIAAGLANGATGLSSSVYGLKEPAEARQKALLAAIANARDRAAAVAQAQGGSVGELTGVEMVAEEAPAAGTAASPAALLYRVVVKATYRY